MSRLVRTVTCLLLSAPLQLEDLTPYSNATSKAATFLWNVWYRAEIRNKWVCLESKDESGNN